MNAQKAIEVIALDLSDPGAVSLEDARDALKLGIEALKAWESSRQAGGIMQGFLLPGETE